MKKILLTLVVIMTSTAAMAQVDFGIKAGMNANLSTLDFGSALKDFGVTNETKSTMGYHAGLQVRLNTKIGLYFQGDVLYNMSSAESLLSNEGESGTIKQKDHLIDIPVVVGLKMGFFRLYAGPSFSFGIAHSAFSNGEEVDVDVNNKVMGYQAGLGFDILKHVTVDLNYNGGFGKSEQVYSQGDEIEAGSYKKSSQLWLSVGFMF